MTLRHVNLIRFNITLQQSLTCNDLQVTNWYILLAYLLATRLPKEIWKTQALRQYNTEHCITKFTTTKSDVRIIISPSVVAVVHQSLEKNIPLNKHMFPCEFRSLHMTCRV